MKKVMLFLVVSMLTILSSVLSFIVVYSESDNNASRDERGYYTYDYWGNVMTCAPPYRYSRELSYSDLGLDKASQFSSVYYNNGLIYIADMGLNSIYIVDYEFNLVKTIKEFERIDESNNVIIDAFDSPQGITASEDGIIYVADSGNARILVFNSDYSFNKAIYKPNHLSLEGLVFNPIDVSVSYTGRIYVVGENVTYGIMELDSSGNFLNFVGTNTVSVSLVDTLWRMMMSKEQRDYASLILPQQFRSIDVDSDGFVYATSLTENDPIKRLNFDGTDVLVENWFYKVTGDVGSNSNSEFISISANDKGIFMALDRTEYRIFVYNCDGEMIYMLGGNDRVDGYFMQPVDICWLKNDDICVCDTNKSSIIVFEATDFGKAVNAASRYHHDGLYEEAKEYWVQAQKLNSNYDLAYIGIGKTYLYTEDYKKAMEYFKLGNNRTYYSKAYQKQTRVFIENNFGWFVLGIALITAGVVTLKVVKHKILKKGEEDNE